MGDLYVYKCTDCDYNERFMIGGGFLTNDYWADIEEEEKSIKQNVLNGTYGEYLKNIIENKEEFYDFSCRDELYQCFHCRQFSVVREKTIKYNSAEDDLFELKVSFKRKCPKCDSSFLFDRVSLGTCGCPKCGGKLELVSCGKWD